MIQCIRLYHKRIVCILQVRRRLKRIYILYKEEKLGEQTMNVIEKLFGTHSERELKMIRPIVTKIESLRPEMIAKSDEELRDQTRILKAKLADGATLDDILPEAFATVREAARRTLNMEHFPVQLIGGIILHQGRIAEMKTGEGKTLVSTLPAYLNALTGRGVHIVTVNDYLANRDAEWMGKVHRFLGLTVGVVLNDMKNDERRQQYACDITYITNNELGFDYLRDNMVIYKEQLVQRELAYCIIDEVDSVLIDEARTPLIISGQSSKSTKLYETADILAHQMQRGEASGEMTKMTAIMGEEIEETGDFIVNEKDKFVTLTDDGVKKVENFFHIENLSDPENRIARASLITNYQLQIKGYEGSLDNLLTAPAETLLPEAFIKKIGILRLMPLYELLEELFSLFEMNRISDQDAYLFAFFDAVTDYLQSNSSELDGFIRFWEETLCGKTIPSGEMEGIRIFSIHKSKGLEFHTVLLPFCDWKLENETNNQLVWCIPEEAPFNELDIVPVNYSAQMGASVYQKDYQQERLQLWVDNLNLLYVAFTRAGKNLIVWSRKGQKGTMSELLTAALPEVARKNGIDWNEDEPYEQGELCPSSKKEEKVSTNKLTRKPDKLPVSMESMRHEIEFRQSNRSADFIKGIDEEESEDRFINRGRLLHTLFSAIETEKDIDTAIERLIFEGVIGSRKVEEEIRKVTHKAFSMPEIQDWYSGRWQLFNECAIIYKEDGVLQTRRPDRVMMQDGQVVVVDFKFGKPNKKYNKQVQGYMQLLTKMGYSNIRGYLWYGPLPRPLSAGEGGEDTDSGWEKGKVVEVKLEPTYKTACLNSYNYLKELQKKNKLNPTDAERVLWEYFRREQLGYKFRRQQVIDNYIADFACLESKLIIELDGDYHLTAEQILKDRERTERLSLLGYKVIRFKNEEVIDNPETVIKQIKNILIASNNEET